MCEGAGGIRLAFSSSARIAPRRPAPHQHCRTFPHQRPAGTVLDFHLASYCSSDRPLEGVGVGSLCFFIGWRSSQLHSRCFFSTWWPLAAFLCALYTCPPFLSIKLDSLEDILDCLVLLSKLLESCSQMQVSLSRGKAVTHILSLWFPPAWPKNCALFPRPLGAHEMLANAPTPLGFVIV